LGLLLVASLSLAGPASAKDYVLDDKTVPSLDVLAAVEAMGHALATGSWSGGDGVCGFTGYKIRRDRLVMECGEYGERHLVFREMNGVGVDFAAGSECNALLGPGRPSFFSARQYLKWVHVDQEPADAPKACERFAAAWHALARLPATGSLVEEGFESVAASYLAQEPRPKVGEDVRRYSVHAEAAIKAKDLIAAARAYGEGLKLAPWWPQGRYNRALLMGELGFAPEAIQEMKRYLQLVPDAANARQAQDKIYQWEALAKR
jgi:hypothetical protein